MRRARLSAKTDARRRRDQQSPTRSEPWLLSLQRQVGNKAVSGLFSELGERDARPALPAVSDARFDAFVLAAKSLGVGLSAARRLWQIGGSESGDTVTGFARASESGETLAMGGAYGQRHGAPAFRVRGDLRNLGGLNARLGHSGSDAIYGEVAHIVERQLRALRADVQPFREEGSHFGFVVVPKSGAEGGEVARTELEERLADARMLVRGFVANSGLSSVTDPKRPNDPSASGSGVDLTVEDLPPQATHATPAANPGSEVGSTLTTDGTGAGFVGSAEARRQAFFAATEEAGVAAEGAARLYSMTSGSETDALTGFAPSGDRLPTIGRAADYARVHGAPALYAEVDIRNVSGLNASVGRSATNELFARVAELAETRLRGLDATVCPFRHGGDELSFVLVGRPGSDPGSLVERAEALLDEVNTAVREEFSELMTVPHPKYPGQSGTGIVFALTPIGPERTPEQTVSLADQEVERRKAVSAVL
jgi:GGDEF domain-containing protein